MEGVYEIAGQEIGRLVEQKNKKYGDAFAKSAAILEVLFPEGVRPEQYQNFLAITRIIDKMFRAATANDKDGESPFMDIAGYGILGTVNSPAWRQKLISAMGPEAEEILNNG
jgi:hypothetical protein